MPENLTDTKDKILMDTNQLVIALNTQVAVLTTTLNATSKKIDDFILKEDERHERMDTRVTMQRSDIVQIQTRLENLTADVQELKVRSNVWDVLNSFGIIVAAYIGYIFGGR